MSRIGITGHSDITSDSIPYIAAAIQAVLKSKSDDNLIGVTCLARGADQIFARVVIDIGGTIEVILPANDYRERKVRPDNAADFDNLISKAKVVETMPFNRSNSEAYMAASERMLSSIDELVAVWDGEPPAGYGGTADVVEAARKRGVSVAVVHLPGTYRHN